MFLGMVVEGVKEELHMPLVQEALKKGISLLER
jgi:hypothetical protein